MKVNTVEGKKIKTVSAWLTIPDERYEEIEFRLHKLFMNEPETFQEPAVLAKAFDIAKNVEELVFITRSVSIMCERMRQEMQSDKTPSRSDVFEELEKAVQGVMDRIKV
jgi:hypothetical protein